MTLTAQAPPTWTLGDRIAKVIRMISMEKRELAEILGVNPTTISRWTGDHSRPNKAVLMFLADLAEVPVEWLETGEWAPRGSNPEPAVSKDFAWGVNSRLTANRPAGSGRTRHLRAVA